MQKADALLDIYQQRGATTTVLRYEWFTGEPDASKVCQSGSEGGSWKPAPRSLVPVVRRHEDRQGAGCLPYCQESLGHQPYLVGVCQNPTSEREGGQ